MFIYIFPLQAKKQLSEMTLLREGEEYCRSAHNSAYFLFKHLKRVKQVKPIDRSIDLRS